MSFEILLPFRSSGEPLTAVAGYARRLEDEQARVTRELVIQAQLGGLATTAGELVAHVEALSPEGRRDMLDAARVAVGLPTTREVEAESAWEAAQGRGFSRSSAFTFCAHPGCEGVARTVQGALLRPDVRRWFCALHADEATPEDKLPRGLGLRPLPGGGYAMAEDPEVARQADAAASREARRRAEEAERAVEAEAEERYRAAQREVRERELPAHLRTPAA